MLRVNEKSPAPTAIGSAGEGGAAAETIVADPTPKVNATPPLLLRKPEVARLLGVSTRHVERMVHREGFPKPIRVGRSVRWRRADVLRYAEGGGR